MVRPQRHSPHLYLGRGLEVQCNGRAESEVGMVRRGVTVIMCYRVVESTVRAILEQRNRLPEPAGPEVREVQTEAVETEEDMRRRLLEEVNRTFRLERVRRLQEEKEKGRRTVWSAGWNSNSAFCACEKALKLRRR